MNQTELDEKSEQERLITDAMSLAPPLQEQKLEWTEKAYPLQQRLSEIQTAIKAPKNLQGQGVKYKYRSNEAILEAVKPLLKGAILTQFDEIVLIGNRYYVKAVTTLRMGEEVISAVAYARESETSRTGMDLAQLTGSCSSYARKYSISGLLLIDDNKDADAVAEQKTVMPENTVKMPKRVNVKNALEKLETLKKLADAEAKFEKKYGPDALDQLSGNGSNKAETWRMLFHIFFKKLNGDPPVDTTGATELQEEFDGMTNQCSDRNTLLLIEEGLNRNVALQTDENQKTLETLHLAYPE